MASFLQQTLQNRRAELARESISNIKDKPEYVVVVNEPKVIEDELSHIFNTDTIYEVYERFLTTGNPFRFCHILLMSYYIAFQEDDELKSQILAPEDWPAIIPPSYLLEIINITTRSEMSLPA
ncbi:hypothetical protein [Vibrio owensii]|uniref:hypothetical protein n=1 Tax=Vibrio owensii TaxID=696485 RepID=UPI0018F20F90|nr:hypothetical protein [Vibrio owensii]